jgi:TRAP-type transport system periplasmic protein
LSDNRTTVVDAKTTVVSACGVRDLGYLFEGFPQQTKALDAGAAKPLEQALKAGASVQIIGWAYNFGSRSVLRNFPVNTPADLAGKRIRTLPNKIITECLRLMGAAAAPMAFGEIYTALQAGVLDDSGRRGGAHHLRPIADPGRR